MTDEAKLAAVRVVLDYWEKRAHPINHDKVLRLIAELRSVIR